MGYVWLFHNMASLGKWGCLHVAQGSRRSVQVKDIEVKFYVLILQAALVCHILLVESYKRQLTFKKRELDYLLVRDVAVLPHVAEM